LQGYLAMITMQSMTKDFNPPVEINFILYFIQSATELLLCIIVFVAATFVLKYKNLWRKVLVYGLIASILFLMVSPLVNYYNFLPVSIKIPGINENSMMSVAKTSILVWSYTWSIIISAFFIYIIMKLSKEEIKLLFK
ncbi:MAG: hypothetical protein AB1394_14950, partial [Bacteroidota bacterium]